MIVVVTSYNAMPRHEWTISMPRKYETGDISYTVKYLDDDALIFNRKKLKN